MAIKRRDFISLTTIAAAAGLSSLHSCTSHQQNEITGTSVSLQSMTGDVVPISVTEREARIGKAQRLLAEQKMEGLILDCGTSLKYFTGISWWPSERTMVAIIPATGEVKYICPGFEEHRLREQISIGKDVFSWQEDESP